MEVERANYDNLFAPIHAVLESITSMQYSLPALLLKQPLWNLPGTIKDKIQLPFPYCSIHWLDYSTTVCTIGSYFILMNKTKIPNFSVCFYKNIVNNTIMIINNTSML